eukprot:g27380.t1
MKLLQGGNIQGVVHPFVISPRGTLPISRTGGDWSGARGAGRHQRIGRVQWVAAPGVDGFQGSARSALGACCACGEQPKGVFQPTDEFGGWIKQKQDV